MLEEIKYAVFLKYTRDKVKVAFAILGTVASLLVVINQAEIVAVGLDTVILQNY